MLVIFFSDDNQGKMNFPAAGTMEFNFEEKILKRRFNILLESQSERNTVWNGHRFKNFPDSTWHVN